MIGRRQKTPVKHPGSRGGQWYITPSGQVRYGDQPPPHAEHLAEETGRLEVELRRQREIVFRGKRVAGPSDIAAAFRAMTDLDRERLYAVSLDAKQHVLAIECVSVGQVDQTWSVAREILKAPRALGASSLYLIHNHPGGDPSPSAGDWHSLTNVRAAARELGIHDVHGVVVAARGWATVGPTSEASPAIEPFPVPLTGRGTAPPEVAAVRHTRFVALGDQMLGPQDLALAVRGLFDPDERTLVAVLMDSRWRVITAQGLGIGLSAPEDAIRDRFSDMLVAYNATHAAIVAGENGPDWSGSMTRSGHVDDWYAKLHTAAARMGITRNDPNQTGLLDFLVGGRDHWRSLLGEAAAMRDVLRARRVVMPAPAIAAEPQHEEEGSMRWPAWLRRLGARIRVKAQVLPRRRHLDGLDVAIENPAGSVRQWHDPHAERDGETVMAAHYGFLIDTIGLDGDEVDVFLKPGLHEEAFLACPVFLVHTRKPPAFTELDEQKVMLGWPTLEAAREAFLTHYDDERFIGQIDQMSWDEFRRHATVTVEGNPMLRGETVHVARSRVPLGLGEPARRLVARRVSRTLRPAPEGE